MNRIGHEALANAIVNKAIKDAKKPTILSYKDVCFGENPCPYMEKNNCFCKNRFGNRYFRLKGKDDYFYKCDLRNYLLGNELRSFFESDWFKILLGGRDVDRFLEYHGIFIKRAEE